MNGDSTEVYDRLPAGGGRYAIGGGKTNTVARASSPWSRYSATRTVRPSEQPGAKRSAGVTVAPGCRLRDCVVPAAPETASEGCTRAGRPCYSTRRTVSRTTHAL